MQNTNTVVELFSKHALAYQERFMDLSLYEDGFAFFCARIVPEDAQLLELACGPGNITKCLLRLKPRLNILGTDFSAAMVELAQKNNPEAAFKVMDCRNIDVPLTRYDAIMIGFCLPYLSPREAAELIHNAAALLKSGGVLYISTMEEDENNTSGIKTSSAGEHIFMYFHNARYLLETAITAGFELLLQKRQDYPGNGVKINTDLIFIFKKR